MKNINKPILIILFLSGTTSNMYPMFDFDPMHVYDAVSQHLTNLHESFTNLMQAYHEDQAHQQQLAVNQQLHSAVENHEYYYVKDLLIKGADPNAIIDDSKNRPLHKATSHRMKDLLISYNANPNAKNIQGLKAWPENTKTIEDLPTIYTASNTGLSPHSEKEADLEQHALKAS